jgi:uncharacterized membrane protein
MDPILLEWLNLGLRWLHVMAGIAWIGTSFYFIALDLALRNPGGLPIGVHGETWQVHGGGFYRMQKYTVAPAELPEELTWFKWEAYTTWISGFALLAVLYYWHAELYLIDPAVMALAPWQAVAIGVASLLVGLVVYEGLCRSPLGQDDRRLALVGFLLLVAAGFAYAQIFSGRGAFIHVGSLIGTIMVASVAHVIIPNQRKVVAALKRGEVPEARLGQQARQRSLHNNYLTLPVVFVMISNHYPLTFASRFNWIILAIIIVVGFAIRHFFNERHKGRPSPWWTLGVAAAGMVLVIVLGQVPPASEAGASAAPSAGTAGAASADAAHEIVLARCAVCHMAQPAWAGIAVAPKGVLLDTPERIERHAREIWLQAVATHAMPPGNLSAITAEERAQLAAWLAPRIDAR